VALLKLRPLKVAEVNNYIKQLMNRDPILHHLTVEGEISNFKKHTSGHLYFTLKDGEARLSCVMFRSDTLLSQIQLSDGLKVSCTGSISIYERDGRYQLYVKSVESLGVGDLYQRFEALKNELSALGYFDPKYKKPIPELPQRIAVITSPTGAALQDILNVGFRRSRLPEVILLPVAVQGEGAGRDIAGAIRRANAMKLADVLLIGRGGGSIEELWAFNERVVAEAIHDSDIPVVSAVGHETDFTISDFTSDMRVPTPSAGAELLFPSDRMLLGELGGYLNRMTSKMNAAVTALRHEIERHSPQSELRRLQDSLNQKRLTLDYERDHLEQNLHNRLRREKTMLSELGAALNALSPLSVLGRGYAVLTDESGKAVDETAKAVVGQKIRATLKDGALDLRVEDVRKEA
jgi:exodeoxyribonuclease VII large subunit